MRIRCVIDGLTLHGMPLSPLERVQLERALHAQLASALRSGWAGAQDGPRPLSSAQLRIDLSRAAGPLGPLLGQSLGAALSPATETGPAPSRTSGAAAWPPEAGAGPGATAPGNARSR